MRRIKGKGNNEVQHVQMGYPKSLRHPLIKKKKKGKERFELVWGGNS